MLAVGATAGAGLDGEAFGVTAAAARGAGPPRVGSKADFSSGINGGAPNQAGLVAQPPMNTVAAPSKALASWRRDRLGDCLTNNRGG
jgi:hypothetical protein